MIEKMTKYSFVMLSGGVDGFLTSLQHVGMLDIKRSTKPVDDESASMFSKVNALSKHIADIESDKYTRDAEYVSLNESLAAAQKEYKERLPWGSFDSKAVRGLADMGLKMRFYCVSSKKFDPSWADMYALEIVDKGDEVRFVTVGPVEGYEFPVEELDAPAGSADETQALINEINCRIADKVKALDKEKDDLPRLRKEYSALVDDLEKYLAGVSTETAAEDMISVIEGFAPTKEDAVIKEKLDAMDVYYVSAPATKEDNPPIKLRNNWFARQFESLTGMYGMPLYDEWDPTPILAPFYMLFFAMCMGDAGYGLVLIAIAYAFKGIKGPGPLGLAPYWKLIRSLGFGTLVVGLFLGTLFGVSLNDAAWFPEALKKFLLVGNVGQFPLQMVLALGVGVFHLCIAMVVKTLLYTQRFGFKSTISTWGWTILIVGGLITLAVGAVAHLPATVTKWIIIGLAAVSCLGIFIFRTPGKNPLLNVGAGLWDTYQMATGLLGDVLSYIRLYALGLAGGMLGSAFNTLGGIVLGSNPTYQWVFFVLIVVFGHALNLLMSCLGAFVHPIRLTFVEYFKNSGYEGRGEKFRPFTSKQ